MEVISLSFLIVLLVSSIVFSTNPGVLGFFLTFVYFILKGTGFKEALAGFPVSMYVMIMSMLIFFGYAQVNGTIDKLCKYLLKYVRGKVAIVPIIIFLLTTLLGATGPASYIIFCTGPIAMNIAAIAEISPVLMAIMLCNGGSASSLSPVAAGGVVAYSIIAKMGLPESTSSIINQLFINGVIGNAIVCVIAYVMFGGLKLLRENRTIPVSDLKVEPFTTKQKINLVLIGLMIVAIVGFKQDIAMVCITLSTVCSVFKLADDNKVFKSMNWSILLLLAGISTLVAVTEKAGGVGLFTSYVASSSTPSVAVCLMGFLSGLVSSYAASTGVVLPSFLPLVGDLLQKMPSIHYMALLSAVTFCTYVVDASPLSTAGAACIAFTGEGIDKKKLYDTLLYWGLAVTVISPIIAVIVFDLIIY